MSKLIPMKIGDSTILVEADESVTTKSDKSMILKCIHSGVCRHRFLNDPDCINTECESYCNNISYDLTKDDILHIKAAMHYGCPCLHTPTVHKEDHERCKFLMHKLNKILASMEKT